MNYWPFIPIETTTASATSTEGVQMIISCMSVARGLTYVAANQTVILQTDFYVNPKPLTFTSVPPLFGPMFGTTDEI